MTAERPGGEGSPGGEGLTAIIPPSANTETSAVTLCPGFYLRNMRNIKGVPYAQCDVCGVLGDAGYRCQQTVIET